TGILRAVKQAGRETDVMVVGLGADETETMVKEAAFPASVGSFPERYGNALIPIALAELAGKNLPDAILINHVMVTKGNVCKYYPKFPCAEGKDIDYKFPQDAFEKYLAQLKDQPWLKGVTNLVPTH